MFLFYQLAHTYIHTGVNTCQLQGNLQTWFGPKSLKANTFNVRPRSHDGSLWIHIVSDRFSNRIAFLFTRHHANPKVLASFFWSQIHSALKERRFGSLFTSDCFWAPRVNAWIGYACAPEPCFQNPYCYIFGLCIVFTYVEKTQREKKSVCAKALQLTTDNNNHKKVNSKGS